MLTEEHGGGIGRNFAPEKFVAINEEGIALRRGWASARGGSAGKFARPVVAAGSPSSCRPTGCLRTGLPGAGELTHLLHRKRISWM
jgi:hypothetical protein